MMTITAYYINPYSEKNFLGFFVVLLERIWGYFSGAISFEHPPTDEIQLIVLCGVAISSSLVGSFLVLRKMTMLANSLSHTLLLGIVVVYWLTQKSGSSLHLNIEYMLLASFAVAVLTAFLTEFLTKAGRLQEDASIGIVFTTLFALGLVLVTLLTRNVHLSTEAVMGNADALQKNDVQMIFIVLAINLVLFVLFFKEFKITTFDPALARTFGISTAFFNYMLMFQTAATSVGAFRAVGVLMLLAFMTGPVLTARMLTHDLRKMLFLSSCLGCLAAVLGVAISRHFLTVYNASLSTGGLVVCVISFIYLITTLKSRFALPKAE